MIPTAVRLPRKPSVVGPWVSAREAVRPLTTITSITTKSAITAHPRTSAMRFFAVLSNATTPWVSNGSAPSNRARGWRSAPSTASATTASTTIARTLFHRGGPVGAHLLDRVADLVRIVGVVFLRDVVHQHRFLVGVVAPSVQDARKDAENFPVIFGQAHELPFERAIGIADGQADLQGAFDDKPLVELAVVCMPRGGH